MEGRNLSLRDILLFTFIEYSGMIKYLLAFVFLFTASVANAQRNIIESLQTRQPGEGVVSVHQDSYITSLIGLRYAGNAASSGAPKTLKARGFPRTGICRKQFTSSTE